MESPPLNPDTQGLAALPFCVARITAGVAGAPTAIAYGTGFLYRFSLPGGDLICLVSNKHVLEGRPWIEVGFAQQTADGRRAFGPSTNIRVPAGALPVIGHPDPDVDLAIMPIVPLVNEMKAKGFDAFVLSLDNSVCITPDRAEALTAATDVIMVGFPNGLMDEANNLPVVRRGSLATPYRANYAGSRDFVIDIAAFGGSSGSPVFAFFNGMEPTPDGMTMGGQSFYLIGVLHSGPVLNAEGRIEQRPVPTQTVIVTQQMIHLGYCAKIDLLQDFLPYLERVAGPPPA
ncbi:S1 family peptidase [Brevundimonas sp. UBA2416]|uniref:S1 family peptidase n=1 Tax=Brevundimonas sp. UBA2416 TaxID=1946124 RepID=UPI0025C3D5F3|nr:serine protease [Brevundimonas sp. UBA2416]HRJ63575.1 serine protease [Brevundimonas sp.]